MYAEIVKIDVVHNIVPLLADDGHGDYNRSYEQSYDDFDYADYSTDHRDNNFKNFEDFIKSMNNRSETEEEIANGLSLGEPQKCVEQLLELALKNGGRDNITLIVIDDFDKEDDHGANN